MAFKMLINKSTVQDQASHRIYEFLQTYKGKHHLYTCSTGSGRTFIAASMIADLLKNGYKVYLLTRGTKEESLFKILAGLTQYDYKDIKNPNFRNKVDVQAKINQVSEEYDSMLEIDTYLHGVNSKKITNQIENKLKSFKAEYVIIEDINALGDEEDYSKKMNLAINSLSNLATNENVSILSFAGTPIPAGTDLPGYFQNSKLLTTHIIQGLNTCESIVSFRQGKASSMATLLDNLMIRLSDKEKTKTIMVFEEAHRFGEFAHQWKKRMLDECSEKADIIIHHPPYKKEPQIVVDPPYNKIEHNGEYISPEKAFEVFKNQFELFNKDLQEKTLSADPNFVEIKYTLSEMGKLAQKLSKLTDK